MKRRLFALLMSLVMLLGLLPTSALADGTNASNPLTPSDKYYTADGKSTTDSNKADITLSKTARRTDGGEWEITLGVNTKKQISQQKAEVIFVLDTSGSMAWCTQETESSKAHQHDAKCYGWETTRPDGSGYYKDENKCNINGHWTMQGHVSGTDCFKWSYNNQWYKPTCGKTIRNNDHIHYTDYTTELWNCNRVDNSSTDSTKWDRLHQSIKAINNASENLKNTLGNNVTIKYVTFSSTKDNGGKYSNHLDVYNNEAEWKNAKITADGGTFLTAGVKKATGQFSKDATTKKFLIIVADGNSDDKYPTQEAANFKKAGGTIYTIGMMFSNDSFKNLASEGCSTTVGGVLDMSKFLENVTNSIAALINDPMGRDVSVKGDATVTVNNGAGTTQSPTESNKLLKWNQDKLETGSEVKMTYTVGLDQITVGDHSGIALNGDAKLNYSYEDNGTTKNASAEFPVPSASYKAASLEVTYVDENNNTLSIGSNPAYNNGQVKVLVTDYGTPSFGYNASYQYATLPYNDNQQYKLKSSTLYANGQIVNTGNDSIAEYLEKNTKEATVAYKVVNIYKLEDITTDPDTYTVIYKWADGTELPSNITTANLPNGGAAYTLEVGTTHTVAAVPTSSETQNAAKQYGKWTCAWDRSDTVSGTANEEITIIGTWTFTPNQLTIVKKVEGATLSDIPNLKITATNTSNPYISPLELTSNKTTDTTMSLTFNASAGDYKLTETGAAIGGKDLSISCKSSVAGTKGDSSFDLREGTIQVSNGSNIIVTITNTYSDSVPTTGTLTITKQVTGLPNGKNGQTFNFTIIKQELKNGVWADTDTTHSAQVTVPATDESETVDVTLPVTATGERYRIEETTPSDVTVGATAYRYDASKSSISPKNFTINGTENASVTVINAYAEEENPPEYGSIKVVKQIRGLLDNKSENYDNKFEFVLKDGDGNQICEPKKAVYNATNDQLEVVFENLDVSKRYTVSETASSAQVDGYMVTTHFSTVSTTALEDPIPGNAVSDPLTISANTTTTVTCTNTYEEIPNDTYTLIYDANGGTGAPASESEQSTTGSAKFTVSSTEPTRSNRTFLGWSLDPKATSASYTAGMTIEVSDSDTNRTKTLYAVWAKNNTPEDPDDEKYRLTLVKLDAADDSPLKGARFELWKVGAKKSEGVYKTNQFGEINATVSTSGNYYWVEVEAPEGYTLDDSEHYTSTGKNNKVTVYNDKTSTPGILTDDHFAYIIGYTDGTVQPGGNITRAEVATIFFRLLRDDVREEYMTSSNPFSDVREGKWFNHAISTLYSLDILNGYEDGKFHPNATITRAEFAAIAARFSDKKVSVGNAPFSDIQNHWAKDEISYAAALGWVNGYTDGTFKPNQPITRAEAMTLVNRVLNRNPKSVDDLLDNMVKWPDNMNTAKWYYLAVQEATNSHDYDRSGSSEYWTKLQSVRDWAALEY